MSFGDDINSPISQLSRRNDALIDDIRTLRQIIVRATKQLELTGNINITLEILREA